jgi:hypothetical protein
LNPCTAASTETTPDTATIDPTDRSIPLVRMTKVSPAARIALIDIDRAMLSRLSALAKLGAMAAIKATRTTRTTRMPTRSHHAAKSKVRLLSADSREDFVAVVNSVMTWLPTCWVDAGGWDWMCL